MKTFIYMVRHGESPKTEGSERSRGLTDKGKSDARIVSQLLRDERIDAFFSSPYRRAVLTIKELAQSQGEEVHTLENLREMVFSGDDRVLPDKEVYPLVRKMFADPSYAPPGGESATMCRNRSVAALKNILLKYKGYKIAIGTHGAVMTLMMGYFDPQYDIEFLLKTSKPDIYRMEFNEEGQLAETCRLWK